MPDLNLERWATLRRTTDSRHADLAAALFLLALAAVAIGPGLWPGRTPLPLDILGLFEPWRLEWPAPENPILGDPVMEFSSRVAVANAWRGGHLPLWNPAVMSGHPLVGDSITAPFYPLQVLPALIFDDQHAYALQLLLQLWLAGVFMYAWLKRWLRDRGPHLDADAIAGNSVLVPALIGAMTWQLAVYQQVWLAYPYFLGTLMWLPIVAYGWEAYVQRHRGRALAVASFGLGMALLGGQLQFVLYGGIVLAIYGLGRMSGWETSRRRRALGGGAVIAVLGLALGAVSLLPALELAGEAARPAMSAGTLRETGIGVGSLLRLVDAMNTGVSGAARNEQAVYLGFIPLLVLMLLPFLNRSRRCIGSFALCLVVFAIAAGTPLGQALSLVPLLNQLGLMRWLAVWPLVAGLAVAVGLDAAARARLGPDPGPPGGGWLRGRGALLPWLAFAVGLVLSPVAIPLVLSIVDRTMLPLAPSALVFLASWIAFVRWIDGPTSRFNNALLVGALGVDLLAAGWRYTPSAPLDQAFPALAPLDRLVAERQREPFRVAAVQRGVIALGPAVPPSLGLDEIGGYSSVVRQSYRAFMTKLAAPPDNDALKSNANMITVGDVHPVLPQLLNVRYLLSAEGLDPFISPLSSAGDCQRVRLLRMFDASSRALIASADGFNHLDVAVWGNEPLGIHVYETDSDEPTASQSVAYGSLKPGTDSAPLPEGSVVRDGSRVYVDGPSGPLPPTRTFYFPRQAHSKGRRYLVTVGLSRGQGTPGFPSEDFINQARAAVCEDPNGLQLSAWAEQEYPPAAAAHGLVVQRPIRPPLGRAWWVGEAVTVTDQAAALEAVTAAELDPARVVVVERRSDPPFLTGGTSVRGDGGTGGEPRAQAEGVVPGQVRAVTDEGPNAMRAQVEAPSGGWLVLSDAFAPGWSATVDGQSAQVQRAYGGIRAVALPAGAREVMLSYRPASFAWGLALTLLGAAGVGLIGLGWEISRRHNPAA